MKIFLRILTYANTIGRRLGFFFLYSILGIIFGAFNIVLVIPMLSSLFKQSKGVVEVPPVPDFSFSTDFIVQLFYHYYNGIIRDYGQLNSLLFVCGLIVVCVIL